MNPRRTSLIGLWVATVVLTCGLISPGVASANNVGTSDPHPQVGGPVKLTIPADGHQVYKVNLASGDWLIGYTKTADSRISVLEPSATDVASDTVATSSPSGILYWQAPTSGAYYCDFAAAAGTVVTRGLFVSRPVLTMRVPDRLVVAYGSGAVLSCRFSDPLYTYVTGDGPVIGFETVRLSALSGDGSLIPLYSGMTDLNGVWGHSVGGVTRTTKFVFDYPGVVYDRQGFGATRSGVITIVPRVKITSAIPKSAKHGAWFFARGSLTPKHATGVLTTVAEARKKGGRQTFKFGVLGYSSKGSSQPIRARITLPSSGTWYVRYHFPADDNNADTATKWVLVRVK